jgi:hypothetical protein
LLEEIAAPSFEGGHLVLYGRTRDPRFDSLDYPVNLAFGLRQIPCGALAARILLGRLSIQFTVKLINECPDHFWLHQLMPQSIQDLGFQCISAHRQQIAARSPCCGRWSSRNGIG